MESAIEARVKRLEDDVAELKSDVKELLALANKSKGGFWAGMTLAAGIGGIVSWIATHWPWK